ncbi:hypothetical protein FRB93_010001 [Tulasnella sp. JGI-2019a]|nr:hypothetical protein FRB93_010001 [Tulasnella sp. JGI-2019a]
MDPVDPSSFNLQNIRLVNGRNYHYCDQTPTQYVHGETPVLLLMHGFPEFWYEWRYQIGPWTRRGWRVIVPDMLGYGGTDKPDDVSLYTPLSIAADMAGLLDALNIKQPIAVIGHDWGAIGAWAFATRYTERVKVLVPVCIPHQPPFPAALTVPQLVQFVGPELLGYWLFLSSPEAPAIINANMSRLIDLVYRSYTTLCDPPSVRVGVMEKYLTGELKIDGPSNIMSAEERQYCIKILEAGGIDKPLNYYKSTTYRFEQEQELKLNPVLPSTLPILLVAPTAERFATPERIEATRPFVPSMEVVHPEAAHFVLLEKRDEVTQIIGDWLEKKLKVE